MQIKFNAISSAFSLIELMVVVAIIAVLAAVALPAYDIYMVKAKLTTSLSYINAFDTDISEYYSSHSVFPSTLDLGLSDTVDYNNPQFSPYVIVYEGPGDSVVTGSQCTNATYLSYLTNYDGGNGFTGDGHIMYYSNIFIDVNGVIQKYCYYVEGNIQGGVSTTEDRDVVPGCIITTTLDIPDSIQSIIDTGCT